MKNENNENNIFAIIDDVSKKDFYIGCMPLFLDDFQTRLTVTNMQGAN